MWVRLGHCLVGRVARAFFVLNVCAVIGPFLVLQSWYCEQFSGPLITFAKPYRHYKPSINRTRHDPNPAQNRIFNPAVGGGGWGE